MALVIDLYPEMIAPITVECFLRLKINLSEARDAKVRIALLNSPLEHRLGVKGAVNSAILSQLLG